MKLSAPNITMEEIYQATRCLKEGQIDPGPAHEEFACALAEWWGVPRSYVLLTNSCTQALGLARQLLRIKREMTAPALTWPGTYCQVGDVCLVDVDTEGVARAADICVNLYGRQSFRTAGSILDSAHSVSPRNVRHLTVQEGHVMCFSFGPTKEITTLRGGALVARNAQSMEFVLRCNTIARVPQVGGGVNGTMTEVGAAMGLSQLKSFVKDEGTRLNVLAMYEEVLKDYEHVELVTKAHSHSGHLAVVRFNSPSQRRRAQVLFAASCVPTSVHYPLRSSQSPDELWPNARAWSETVLTLPCHTKLSADDMKILRNVTQRVADATGKV